MKTPMRITVSVVVMYTLFMIIAVVCGALFGYNGEYFGLVGALMTAGVVSLAFTSAVIFVLILLSLSNWVTSVDDS